MNKFIPYLAQGVSQCMHPGCEEPIYAGDWVLMDIETQYLYCQAECAHHVISKPSIQEMGERETSLGWAMYVRIYTCDYRVLTWSEVWACFSATYPNNWAVQAFPPKGEELDETNIYHLFVLEEAPRGLNINPVNRATRS